MIKNPAVLEKFMQKIISKEKSDYHKNGKIFEELLEYALNLGRFDNKYLDYIEKDIMLAKVINSVGRSDCRLGSAESVDRPPSDVCRVSKKIIRKNI